MKYFYWLCVIAVLAGGLYFSTTFSPPVVRETQSRIGLSQVSTPEELGQLVFSNLQAEVQKAPLIFLGVTPNQIEDMELWRGFFEANQKPGFKYDMIVVEPMLPYVELFDSNMRIDIKAEMPRFVEGVKKALAEGLRVAVIVPSIYSSQLMPKNPAARLKHEFQLQFLSLSVVKFPVTREQEESFEPRCIFEEGKDVAGTGILGCKTQTIARRTYKTTFENNKLTGLMEQLSPDDFLILLNRNAGSR